MSRLKTTAPRRWGGAANYYSRVQKFGTPRFEAWPSVSTAHLTASKLLQAPAIYRKRQLVFTTTEYKAES
jgi:hypothetical protein